MMINRFAKIISAATVLAMAVSLAPQSASAQTVSSTPQPVSVLQLFGTAKFSGNAVDNPDELTFSLGTSIDPIQGTSSGAILNAIYTDYDEPQIPGTTTPIEYKLKPGNLEISLEPLSDSFRQELNNADSSFKGKFDEKAVQYKATLELEDNSNPKYFVSFAFYAPDIDPFANNLNPLSVFNASSLTPFLDSNGKVTFPKNLGPLSPNSNSILTGTIDPRVLTLTFDNVTKVPEPAATASLLSFGIVSTALLRKRNKRLETSLSNSQR
jgi:hypothetical protein